MSVPSSFQKAFAEQEIKAKTAQMAEDILPWAREVKHQTGRQPLAVCVLRGGVYFFTDLMRAMPVSVEATFCRTWSYSSQTNEHQSGVRVSVGDVECEGRGLLVVDDICDTGSTLRKLEHVFRELGAADVRTAVLIHRQVPDSVYEPHWSAFTHQGPEWFVGYGMEDRNHYSNLRDVYIVEQK
ncbi:MAG: hypothetical protein KDD66_13185 [Bdellovibrionales bacterium]|nr:hypothetical protein [Bdellovibrionales bacterium]